MTSHKLVVIVILCLSTQCLRATEWYVSPEGAAMNVGTRQSPWDVASALNGRDEVRPGDTIFLLEGIYRRRPNELFDVRLKGLAEQPVHVRPAPGQRARMDGGLAVQSPSAHVWIRGLEVFVSEPLPDKPVSAGSRPPDLKRPSGGLHMHGGTNCKYINLILARDAPRPAGARVVLLPNKYDPSRLYLAVYNWGKADTVEVKTGSLLRDGDTVELRDPKNVFGDPVAKAICRDGVIRVPIQGEFAVFVLRISGK